MAGDCFERSWDAARTAMLDIEDRTSVLLVHGLPIGQGPINNGKRYWHAWVEVKTSAGWLVLDWTTGSPLEGKAIKRATYYRIAQIDQRLVWRYTIPEAYKIAERLMTYGPWVEGWQQMEDESLQVASTEQAERQVP